MLYKGLKKICVHMQFSLKIKMHVHFIILKGFFALLDRCSFVICIEYKKWSLQYFSLDITFIYMNCKKDNFCMYA